MARASEVWLYTDGASRENPGPGAAGYHILSATHERLASSAKLLGDTTNNRAEYQAVIIGLEACRAWTTARVRCVSDSKLLVDQLNERARVKEPALRELHAAVRRLQEGFEQVDFQHRPRTHPELTAVDRRVRELLDSIR